MTEGKVLAMLEMFRGNEVKTDIDAVEEKIHDHISIEVITDYNQKIDAIKT